MNGSNGQVTLSSSTISSLHDVQVAYAMREERNADAGIDMSVNAHDMRYSR